MDEGLKVREIEVVYFVWNETRKRLGGIRKGERKGKEK
jgi:hypothetical protein